MTTVGDVMTRGVRSLSPQHTLQFAAQAMAELAVGAIPVCEGRRLVGMVTDRDITVRGVANGLQAERDALAQVMSTEVLACAESQSIEQAAQQMCEAQVRRLPVVDDQQCLVGMLSLGDVAVKFDAADAAKALRGISTPAEPDRTGLSAAAGGAGGGADAESRGTP